jgi:hypothetical protein
LEPNPLQKQRIRYSSVMWCYLVSGILGLLFIAGETLNQAGLWSPLIQFLFGDNAEGVFMFFSAVVMLATIGLVLLLFVGWIPAIIVIVRFRTAWRAVMPVGLLLIGCLVSVAGLLLELVSDSISEIVMGVAVTLYFVSAAAIGIEWLYRGRPDNDPT